MYVFCSIDYCDFAPNKFIPCISAEALPNCSEFNIMKCNSGVIIALNTRSRTETLYKEKTRDGLLLAQLVSKKTTEGINAPLTPSSLKAIGLFHRTKEHIKPQKFIQTCRRHIFGKFHPDKTGTAQTHQSS